MGKHVRNFVYIVHCLTSRWPLKYTSAHVREQIRHSAHNQLQDIQAGSDSVNQFRDPTKFSVHVHTYIHVLLHARTYIHTYIHTYNHHVLLHAHTYVSLVPRLKTGEGFKPRSEANTRSIIFRLFVDLTLTLNFAKYVLYVPAHFTKRNLFA